MVDSDNSPDNYKILKISFGTIIKHPEMLKFVCYHHKTKKMCKRIVKKLPFVKIYALDWYKTQEKFF